MTISTVCGDCRKKYTVKDEMAGKRFRCKECQSIVTVPDTLAEDDEDDPFAGVDLQSAGKPIRKRRVVEEDDDDDDDRDDEEAPRRPTRSKSKPVKKKKRSRGPGMPATAIIAITAQCLLTMFAALICLVALMTERYGGDAAAKAGGAIGPIIRLIIAIPVLLGLLRRSHLARQWSRAICAICALFGSIGLIGAVILAPKTDVMLGMIIVLFFQVVLWVTLLFCLSSESGTDWFSE